MPVDLHIALKSLVNDSRILKETAGLVGAGLVDRIYIAALHSEGLEEHTALDEQRQVWRVRLRTRRWPSNLLVQFIKYVEYSVRVLSYAREIRANVITIHSLGLLPLGAVAKWAMGTRLVYDCHELETETFGLTGVRQWLSRQVERLLIRQADMVLVVSRSIQEWYKSAYGIRNVYLVMNCPPMRRLCRTDKLQKALGIPSGRRLVLYQGGLVRGRGVEGLLEAFALHDDGLHALVLMGYGELTPLVAEYAARHGNIFLQPAVAPDVVLEYTASADIGVSYIDNESLNDRFCLPNKLFEYIMAGLPVMVNDAPEMKRLVEEEQIGVVLRDLSVHSVLEGIRQLEREAAVEMRGRLARTASEYNWERQFGVLAAAYRKHVLE